MAYNSPNLGLVVWDLQTDDFEPNELANNWVDVDEHDHSPGHGVQISGAGIADDSITQNKLAPFSVGHAELQQDSVDGTNIEPASVTGANIAAETITGSNIANGAIGVNQLDPTLIPLGMVAMFWRPAGSGNVPGGFWELLDGRAWNGVTNAWNLTAGFMPDTRGLYANGADINGVVSDAPGVGGGSWYTNLSHTHSVTIPALGVGSHTHAIGEDGGHHHTFANGFYPWLRSNAFQPWPEVVTVYDYAGTQRTADWNTMYLKNYNIAQGTDAGGGGGYNQQFNRDEFIGDIGVGMDGTGTHDHTGATGAGGGGATGTSSTTSSAALGETLIEPPYMSFAFMMRCR